MVRWVTVVLLSQLLACALSIHHQASFLSLQRRRLKAEPKVSACVRLGGRCLPEAEEAGSGLHCAKTFCPPREHCFIPWGGALAPPRSVTLDSADKVEILKDERNRKEKHCELIQDDPNFAENPKSISAVPLGQPEHAKCGQVEIVIGGHEATCKAFYIPYYWKKPKSKFVLLADMGQAEKLLMVRQTGSDGAEKALKEFVGENVISAEGAVNNRFARDAFTSGMEFAGGEWRLAIFRFQQRGKNAATLLRVAGVPDDSYNSYTVPAGGPYNMGGNFLISPPFGKHKYGVVCVGHKPGDASLHLPLVTEVERLKLQPVVKCDTSWLNVKHIDEVLTIVPSKKGDDGFVVVLAEVDKKNDDLEEAKDALDDCYQQLLKTGLHKSVIERVQIPFQGDAKKGGGDSKGLGTVDPNPINLVLFKKKMLIPGTNADSTTTSAPPDTPMPNQDHSSPASTKPEHKISEIGRSLGWAVEFIDDKGYWHNHDGEVHCGTNSIPTLPHLPPPPEL